MATSPPTVEPCSAAARATAPRPWQGPELAIGARAQAAALVSLGFAPQAAHAQQLSMPIALAVVSPLAAALLAVVLGLATRSWRATVAHLTLLSLWIVLFLLAAQNVDNDYVVWTPLVLYAAHVLVLLALLGIRTAQLVLRWSRIGRGAR